MYARKWQRVTLLASKSCQENCKQALKATDKIFTELTRAICSTNLSENTNIYHLSLVNQWRITVFMGKCTTVTACPLHNGNASLIAL